jgi:hypothetical protein
MSNNHFQPARDRAAEVGRYEGKTNETIKD